jgi:hypothetical protein
MRRIPQGLEHPTKSSNAAGDDSAVGHRRLQGFSRLVWLADRTSDPPFDVVNRCRILRSDLSLLGDAEGHVVWPKAFDGCEI